MHSNTHKLLHMVYFWLKEEHTEHDKAQLIEGLQGLADIDLIKAIHIDRKSVV